MECKFQSISCGVLVLCAVAAVASGAVQIGNEFPEGVVVGNESVNASLCSNLRTLLANVDGNLHTCRNDALEEVTTSSTLSSELETLRAEILGQVQDLLNNIPSPGEGVTGTELRVSNGETLVLDTENGTYSFQRIVVESGGTLKATGSLPLLLNASVEIVINGAVDLSGQAGGNSGASPGANGEAYGSPAAGGGGGGGAVKLSAPRVELTGIIDVSGGDGGDSGDGVSTGSGASSNNVPPGGYGDGSGGQGGAGGYSGGAGRGLGTGRGNGGSGPGGGTSGLEDGGHPPGSGGAGHARPGDTAPGYGGGLGGDKYGSPALENLMGGSGGAGGGNDGDNEEGCGGGGAGGAVYIHSEEFFFTGSIDTRGGRAGYYERQVEIFRRCGAGSPGRVRIDVSSLSSLHGNGGISEDSSLYLSLSLSANPTLFVGAGNTVQMDSEWAAGIQFDGVYIEEGATLRAFGSVPLYLNASNGVAQINGTIDISGGDGKSGGYYNGVDGSANGAPSAGGGGGGGALRLTALSLSLSPTGRIDASGGNGGWSGNGVSTTGGTTPPGGFGVGEGGTGGPGGYSGGSGVFDYAAGNPGFGLGGGKPGQREGGHPYAGGGGSYATLPTQYDTSSGPPGTPYGDSTLHTLYGGSGAASGGNDGDNEEGCGSGGSGGAIWLETSGHMNIQGTLTVEGGDGGKYELQGMGLNGMNGGYGRIRLDAESLSLSPTASVVPGIGHTVINNTATVLVPQGTLSIIDSDYFPSVVSGVEIAYGGTARVYGSRVLEVYSLGDVNIHGTLDIGGDGGGNSGNFYGNDGASHGSPAAGGGGAGGALKLSTASPITVSGSILSNGGDGGSSGDGTSTSGGNVPRGGRWGDGVGGRGGPGGPSGGNGRGIPGGLGENGGGNGRGLVPSVEDFGHPYGAGGGGFATAGGNGRPASGGGLGGSPYGSSTLVPLQAGSSGAGGSNDNDNEEGCGGAGSGGSIYLSTTSLLDISGSLIQSLGGSGGLYELASVDRNCGSGGNGRIRMDYAEIIRTGATQSPAAVENP